MPAIFCVGFGSDDHSLIPTKRTDTVQFVKRDLNDFNMKAALEKKHNQMASIKRLIPHIPAPPRELRPPAGLRRAAEAAPVAVTNE